ncbi:MAG: hypothetical protein ACKO6N_24300 [Myxococcota bacterium]
MSERDARTQPLPTPTNPVKQEASPSWLDRSSGLWRSLSLLLLASSLALAGLWLKEKREALSVLQTAEQHYQRAASIDAQVKALQRSLSEQQVYLGQVESLMETLVDPQTQRWQAHDAPVSVQTFVDLKRQRLAVFVLGTASTPPPALQLWAFLAQGEAQSLGMLSVGTPATLFVPFVGQPERLELHVPPERGTSAPPSSSPWAVLKPPAP